MNLQASRKLLTGVCGLVLGLGGLYLARGMGEVEVAAVPERGRPARVAAAAEAPVKADKPNKAAFEPNDRPPRPPRTTDQPDRPKGSKPRENVTKTKFTRGA